MNNLTLFPSSTALLCASEAKSPNRTEERQQLAYLRFLSVLAHQPLSEVVTRVAAGTRRPPLNAKANS